jgi:hypothetical protein
MITGVLKPEKRENFISRKTDDVYASALSNMDVSSE